MQLKILFIPTLTRYVSAAVGRKSVLENVRHDIKQVNKCVHQKNEI
jgi:hypothetical protein